MKAFKLINTGNGQSAFQEGSVPELQHIPAVYFFSHTHVDPYERSSHPAPRYQFVITLKGKLKFTVSNGATFIIEPGIVLIADDLHGGGHTWEIIDGDEWHRIYIVLPPQADDHFKISGDVEVIA